MNPAGIRDLRLAFPCFGQQNSLLCEIFSLLARLGNFAKRPCSAVVSYFEIQLWEPEIADFPVKFPDSREFA
jgi:hypothetical protein